MDTNTTEVPSTNTAQQVEIENPILKVLDLSVFYGSSPALKNIDLNIPANEVTALIGPSGCGKSTLLRCFNRMNDLVGDVTMTGSIVLDEKNILSEGTDVISLRQKVGMVFQKPNPFPKTIYENVAYGLRIAGIKDKAQLDATVEDTLKRSALWDEVKDRLHESAFGLSGGQLQRLCIARAIAVNPEVVLMDEPTSALDPIAGSKIEDLIAELKRDYTVVVVTHNMQQASRISGYTAFLYLGELIEFNDTEIMFTNPAQQKTQDYITGRFG